MRLHRLSISGFKRLYNVQVEFGNATFLIGANNAGKSSVLKTIECLLSNNKRLDPSHFSSELDLETGETKISSTSVILEAEFRNVPTIASEWRGFKGRIFDYEPTDTGETGNRIFYRKTYSLTEDVKIEIKSLSRTLKQQFLNAEKNLEICLIWV